MSKKDKKIEIQINDAKVVVNKATIEGLNFLLVRKSSDKLWKLMVSLPLLTRKML